MWEEKRVASAMEELSTSWGLSKLLSRDSRTKAERKLVSSSSVRCFCENHRINAALETQALIILRKTNTKLLFTILDGTVSHTPERSWRSLGGPHLVDSSSIASWLETSMHEHLTSLTIGSINSIHNVGFTHKRGERNSSS